MEMEVEGETIQERTTNASQQLKKIIESLDPSVIPTLKDTEVKVFFLPPTINDYIQRIFDAAKGTPLLKTLQEFSEKLGGEKIDTEYNTKITWSTTVGELSERIGLQSLMMNRITEQQSSRYDLMMKFPVIPPKTTYSHSSLRDIEPGRILDCFTPALIRAFDRPGYSVIGPKVRLACSGKPLKHTFKVLGSPYICPNPEPLMDNPMRWVSCSPQKILSKHKVYYAADEETVLQYEEVHYIYLVVSTEFPNITAPVLYGLALELRGREPGNRYTCDITPEECSTLIQLMDYLGIIKVPEDTQKRDQLGVLQEFPIY